MGSCPTVQVSDRTSPFLGGTPLAVSTAVPALVERRARRRRPVSYLRVYSPGPGSILDVSSSGICIETPCLMSIGEEFALRMRHRSEIFTLKGTVKWCRLQSEVPTTNGQTLAIYRIGMALVEGGGRRDLAVLTGGVL